MRIGFASVYAWRPHVEHLAFLVDLARGDGHACFFLKCEGELPTCYTRELRPGRPQWLECFACRHAGLHTYQNLTTSRFGVRTPATLRTEDSVTWAQSSAATLRRFETDEEFASTAFQDLSLKLAPAVELVYGAAIKWIQERQLDAVIVFNGRIDTTRAILEAARHCKIRVLSVERSWFGNGLQLLPDESCLGTRTIHRMVGEWSSRPLTLRQAAVAAKMLLDRLRGTNATEWRSYGQDSKLRAWPAQGGDRRLLVLPGSRNEFWGHEDWGASWQTPVAGFDAVLGHLQAQPNEVVVRCHPNWAQRIGIADGRHPERHFTEWARAHGYHVIASADATSTIELIQQSDAVTVASSSAAFDSALLGRQVIGTAPSWDRQSGYKTPAYGEKDLSLIKLDRDQSDAVRLEIVRRRQHAALRFGYTMSGRVPQFVQHVRAVSSAKFRYVGGADPRSLTRLLQTGHLEADDAEYSADERAEQSIVEQLNAGKWQGIDDVWRTTQGPIGEPILRRPLYRPVDWLRDRLPVGDR